MTKYRVILNRIWLVQDCGVLIVARALLRDEDTKGHVRREVGWPAVPHLTAVVEGVTVTFDADVANLGI